MLRLFRNLIGINGKGDKEAGREKGARTLSDVTEHSLPWLEESAGRNSVLQDEIELRYLDVLSRDPENIEALHILGRLKGQQGKFDEAEHFLLQAIEKFPRHVEALIDLGNVKKLLGMGDEAAECYMNALRIDPNNISANFNLGLLLLQNNKPEEAEARLLRVTELAPDLVDAWQHLAFLKLQRGLFFEAAELYGKVMNLNQGDPANCLHYGIALFQSNRINEAALQFEHAISLDPELAAANFYLGIIYKQQGKREEAEDCFVVALHHDPKMTSAYRKLVELLTEDGHFNDALELYRQAISQHPSDAELYKELGDLLTKTSDEDGAIECYQKAVDINPSYAPGYNALGFSVLVSKGQVEKARECFKRASELDPDLIEPRFNYCHTLQDTGDVAGAIECYDVLLRVHPGHNQILWFRTLALLLSGRFKGAWEHYEIRWLHEYSLKRNFAFPRWEGGSLEDKNLLIYAEQGIGDEIMFTSCLPDVINRARLCVIECDPRLEPILARSFPEAIVRGHKRDEYPDWLSHVPPIDLQVPIGSLPKYFRNQWEDFPRHSGYLRANPDRVTYWKQCLNQIGPGLKVGISWRGGTAKSRRDVRSIPLEVLLPILQQPGIKFISLQYTDCADELATFKEAHGINVHHWQEAIDDYDETAALVSALDLVISVCTSIIHLGGALGKSTWVMVPAIPEWRYLSEGNRMPWYPSVSLYRQTEIGIWQPVFDRIIEQLSVLKVIKSQSEVT